jgi:class 3 adenylate cyclase
MPFERKLAAIMFTDIAGYTEQMSKDEAVALSLLNKKESLLKPLVAKQHRTNLSVYLN